MPHFGIPLAPFLMSVKCCQTKKLVQKLGLIIPDALKSRCDKNIIIRVCPEQSQRGLSVTVYPHGM